jgi:hypothetical protein
MNELERIIGAVRKLSLQQMNRLEITYCPVAGRWRVVLGLFRAEEDQLNLALYMIAKCVDDHRRRSKK